MLGRGSPSSLDPASRDLLVDAARRRSLTAGPPALHEFSFPAPPSRPTSRIGSATHACDPVPVPTIAIEFASSPGDLEAAARVLHTYTWVVITSVNGARALLEAAERVFTALETSKFAAIGPKQHDM